MLHAWLACSFARARVACILALRAESHLGGEMNNFATEAATKWYYNSRSTVAFVLNSEALYREEFIFRNLSTDILSVKAHDDQVGLHPLQRQVTRSVDIMVFYMRNIDSVLIVNDNVMMLIVSNDESSRTVGCRNVRNCANDLSNFPFFLSPAFCGRYLHKDPLLTPAVSMSRMTHFARKGCNVRSHSPRKGKTIVLLSQFCIYGRSVSQSNSRSRLAPNFHVRTAVA